MSPSTYPHVDAYAPVNVVVDSATDTTVDTLSHIEQSTTDDGERMEKLDRLLAKWRTRLFVNMWLQERSMYFYASMNNSLTYPIIVISSISSATLFSTNNVAIKYIVGGLSLVTGILTSISRQMRPAELYQQYAMTTLRYQALVRRIETYLSLPVAMREDDPIAFMRKVELEMSALLENQVNPPPYVKSLFTKRFGSLDSIVYGEAILETLRNDVMRNLEQQRHSKRSSISKYFTSRWKVTHLYLK